LLSHLESSLERRELRIRTYNYYTVAATE